MCCFRWCGRQLCLRDMPISGVNSTPRPTAVYASDPASPRRPQDSLPSRLLGFERTRLSLANSFQLSSRTPHPALGQDLTPSSTARGTKAGSDVRARSARRGAKWISRPFAAFENRRMVSKYIWILYISSIERGYRGVPNNFATGS